MAISNRDQKQAWDARIKRINTGRTMTQIAEAEGTIPTRYTKRGSSKKTGVRGLVAWFMGGTIGWMSGLVLSITNPAAQLIEQQELGELAGPVADFGNPLVGCVLFLLTLSILRIRGFMARLIGLTIMAWVFALQAGMDVPTVADLMDMGEAMLAGEYPFTETAAAIRDWAMETIA